MPFPKIKCTAVTAKDYPCSATLDELAKELDLAI
jgi:hypothetical protein